LKQKNMIAMQKGRFISFEGSEGCGKSTQIRLLADALERDGRQVLLTREPGGTVVGEHIRNLLQHTPEAAAMTPEAELLLFAASRAQLVREVIRPALEQGHWVVADRFLDSTTVYQGLARGLDREAVEAVNRFAVGTLLPDLTLLLDMDAAEGLARANAASRVAGRTDRMEDQGLEFFAKVRQGYLELAASEGARIEVIDASGGIDEVQAGILTVLEKRYNEFSR
jgi:dTMP kinase